MHTTGFFSLVNTGFTPAEVQRQYDIAQQYFSLPEAEKGREGQLCDFTQGNYFGYRPVRTDGGRKEEKRADDLQAHHKTVRGTEVRDNAESVNIPKFIPAYASEPFHPFFEPFRDEIEAFSRVNPYTPNLPPLT